MAHLKRGGVIGYNMAVTPTVGSPFSLTEANVIEDSLELDRSQWTTANTVQIGNADAAELIFEIDNSEGQWNTTKLEGADIVFDWDIDGEALRAGKFVVHKQEKGYDTIRIYAMDYMSKLDKKYDGNLTYPANLLQILQDCATDCGVVLDESISTSFMHWSYSVTAAPSEPNMTYRHLVGWVAQLAGCNAWMDWDGQLRMSWYSDATEPFIVDTDMMLQWVIYDESERVVTGVQYANAGESFSVGTSEYPIVFEHNPLLQSDQLVILDAIFNKVKTLTFLPVSMLPTVTLPNIWTGDTLLVDALAYSANDEAGTIEEISGGATISSVNNPSGVTGSELHPTSYYRANVLVGKHRISSRSEMMCAGEIAAPPKSSLSSTQTDDVQTIVKNTPATGIDVITTIGESVTDYANFTVGNISSLSTLSYAGIETPWTSISKLDETRALIAVGDGTYLDDTPGIGKAVIATCSNGTVTFGDAYTFSNGCFELRTKTIDSNHVLIMWLNGGYGEAHDGYCVVATVSGNVISFGTSVRFYTSQYAFGEGFSLARLDASHVVVAYPDPDAYGVNSNSVARVLAISGDAITVGVDYAFNAGASGACSVVGLDDTRFMVFYYDPTGDQHGYAKIATLTGSAISYGTSFDFHTGNVSDISACKTDTDKALIAFADYDTNTSYLLTATNTAGVITFGAKVANTFENGQVGAISETYGVVVYTYGNLSVYRGRVAALTITGNDIEVTDTEALIDSTTVYCPRASVMSDSLILSVFVDNVTPKVVAISPDTIDTTVNVRINSDVGKGFEISVDDTQVIGLTTDDIYIRYPGGTPDNRFGCDATGPYYVKAGVKTYFGEG